MAFQRGDVILVPFPFTDLTERKVRPAVVLSSDSYHATEPDLILGALTTNLNAATAPVDYILTDWQAANLRFPSAFKPLLFSLEPSLVLHTVGHLSAGDLVEINQRVRLALDLPWMSLSDLLATTDVITAPPSQIQTLAERAIVVVLSHERNGLTGTDTARLRSLLYPESDGTA